MWSLICMGISFFITYFCLIKLIQARETTNGGSFSDVVYAAMGLPGRYVLDVLLCLMLYGFVVAFCYFTIINLKEVIDQSTNSDINILYLGVFVFLLTTPLCYMRSIDRFAFSYAIADILVFITAIVILVYSTMHLKSNNWQWATNGI